MYIVYPLSCGNSRILPSRSRRCIDSCLPCLPSPLDFPSLPLCYTFFFSFFLSYPRFPLRITLHNSTPLTQLLRFIFLLSLRTLWSFPAPPPPSPLLFCNLFFLISLHILHDSFNFNLIFPPSPTIYPSLALPSLPPFLPAPFSRVSPPSSSTFPTITAHHSSLSPIRYAHTARVTSRGQHVGEFKHLSLLLFLESLVFAARRNGKYR